MVCPVAALYFTSEEKIHALLKRPGFAKYANGLVRINGVLRHGQSTPIFAVLVGVVREINHASGDAKANVKLVVDASAGFNTGLLQLRVCGPGKRGLGANKELLLDYGPSYNLSIPLGLGGEPEAKRSRTIHDFMKGTGVGSGDGGAESSGCLVICPADSASGSMEIVKSDAGDICLKGESSSLPKHALLHQWFGGAFTSEAGESDVQLPAPLKSSTFSVFNSKLKSFEDLWKEQLRSNDKLTLYGMYEASVKSPDQCDQKLTVHCKKNLVCLPPPSSSLSTLVPSFNDADGAKFHLIFKVQADVMVPCGMALVSSKTLRFSDGICLVSKSK